LNKPPTLNTPLIIFQHIPIWSYSFHYGFSRVFM